MKGLIGVWKKLGAYFSFLLYTYIFRFREGRIVIYWLGINLYVTSCRGARVLAQTAKLSKNLCVTSSFGAPII
jgi:hypothetical protein